MSSDQVKAIDAVPTDGLLQVVGSGSVLALLLIRIRGWEAGLTWQVLRPWVNARKLAALGYYDVVYVTFVTAAFAAGLVAARRRPRAQRILAWLYVATAVLTLIMACVNQTALRELGSPLTYQWLYYSDFLRSLDAYNAMQALVTWDWLKVVAVRCVWLLVGSYIVVRGLGWLVKHVRIRWLATPLVTGLCLAIGMERRWTTQAHSDPAKLQNPIVALAASAFRTDERRLLTGMPTSVPPTDFLPAGARAVSEGTIGMALRERARKAGVRNVLVVVLESVAAQYMDGYGAPYGATPHLDRYRQQAMLFTRVYAHVPSTLHSLVEFLLSVYHPHSFRVITKEYPRVRLPSLSSELERRGYRTAFFNGADNRFQRQDVFLQAHAFDRLEDHRDFRCAVPVFRVSDKTWPYVDGVADRCAANRVAEWAGDPAGAPFVAVFWTMQTHFPYFLTEAPRDFGVRDSMMNRYLNALRETDRALGSLLAALEERHLLDSTLVIVVGDHGEAFGQHGHYVHGNDLYEEEVHVPLMLINGQLFHGETDSTVGGMIDIAPTIMDLLGDPLPESWQGRSLFDDDRPGRVYLFSPHSRVLFGYREGPRKYIYDAGGNTSELYDLRTDPGESLNVAVGSPAMVLQSEQRLATWVQYQQRFFEGILVRDSR
jgi:arylsulfatase A-like enzyme